jgi:hypothetical protein
MIAQGNALCLKYELFLSPEGALYSRRVFKRIFILPFQGASSFDWGYFQGRCPWLSYLSPSGKISRRSQIT